MMKGKINMKNAINNNKNKCYEKLLQVYLLDDTLENQEACPNDDMLEARELAEQFLKMKKLSTLKKQYPIEKVKRRPDGRYYVYIKRKQVAAPTYDLLMEKLYDKFYGVQNYTLTDIFPQWQLYRRDVERKSSKTLKDHNGYWNNYIKDSKIAKMPIAKITPRDITNFYETVVTQNEISKGTLELIRTILKKLFDFAIVQYDIIRYNFVLSISITPYENCFKETEDNFDDVYKKKDRDKLLNHLENFNNDIYSLGIQLAFRLIVRIGELKALKWEDVDIENKTVYLRHQTVERQIMNDDLTFQPRTMETINRMKGKKRNGKRIQSLTDEAIEILAKIKQLNPNGEYVLMNDERQLSTCTFNRHLKAFCENAGVTYHSSQKIRFTSASMLYDGTNLALLSQLLGHTTTTMTLHYFRNILGNGEIQQIMSKLDRNADEVA